MTMKSALPATMLMLTCFTAAVSAHRYYWDPGCECWVPDTTGPTLPDDTADPNVPPDPEPSKFVLTGTGVDSNGNRALSDLITFDHHQPDGVVETRSFRYSTPRNFAARADNSVNLWLVFHGGNGNTTTMHNNNAFNRIPHDAPTLLVYPQALRVTYLNDASSDHDDTIMWRSPKVPGSGDDRDAFRDVTFIDRLVTRLLVNNPQINANKVYASGFSSGGMMTWMLLCYPLYSMDYGGEWQDRDDISSVGWLLARHQLPDSPNSACTVIDANPGDTDHVVTRRFEYAAPPPSSPSQLVPSRGEPVTWYEMRGAGHDVSTLDQPAGASNSTDFYASLHTKAFFEERAGMLQGPSSGSVFTFQCTLSHLP